MEQSNPKTPPPGWLSIAPVLMLFLLMEIYPFFYHALPLTRKETDGIGYMQRAVGPLFSVDPFHGPGYPLAIRLVHATGMGLFPSAKLATLASGILFLLATWLLLSSITSAPNALLATSLVCTNSVFVFRSGMILGDVTAVSLLLMGLAVILSNGCGPKGFLFAGALCGLAYLTRYIYLVTLAVPWLWLLLGPRGPARLQRTLLFYLGFLLLTGPWLAFLYSRTGNPFSNLNYLNVAFAMNRGHQGWNAFPSEAQFHGLVDVFCSNPVLFAGNWLRNLFSLPWRTIHLFSQLGVLAVVGAFLWLGQLNWKKGVLLTTMLLYSLVLCLTWLEDRLLLPLLPVAASFIASCILALPPQATLPRIPWLSLTVPHRIPLRSVVVVLSIGGMATLTLTKVRSFFADQASEYMMAAQWLSARGKDGTISSMIAKPHIAFFSNTRGIGFGDYKLQSVQAPDLPRVLREAKPAYFIYDERYAAVEFTQFSALLSPKTNPYPDVLEPVLEIDRPKKLVIYKFLDHPTP